MSWFYLEERTVSRPRLMMDLVHHLQRRCVSGTCVIVLDKPTLQLAVLRKEWLRGEYQVERLAASTLGHRRVRFATEHDRLQTVDFDSTETNKDAEVFLVAPGDTTQLPEQFATLYVLTRITDDQRTAFTAQLKRGGLIVNYTITK